MTDLATYLAELRRLAEGALRSETVVGKHQRAFWQGYRQALDDVEQHDRHL